MSYPVKADNVRTVLRLLMRAPGATKPELSKRSGLAPSAIHGVMALLCEKGVAVASGMDASSGGRRAERYRFNGLLGVAVGVSIRLHQMETGVFDLDGSLLCAESQPLELTNIGPESYVGCVAQSIDRLLRRAGRTRESCYGVGILLPGPVDVETGTVLQISGAKLWQMYPLASRLSGETGLPVFADKDVYGALVHLDASGQLSRKGCSAFLSIREGIGAAVMINGRIFRGSHSLAGEIGHATVRRDGAPCHCGNAGCLELYCSDIGILSQYNAQASNACHSVSDVLLLLEKRDPVAVTVFSQAMRYLVDTTSTIIMSYDPDELLIYCRWLNSQRSLYFNMLDALYAKSIFTQKHAVSIRLLGDEPIYLNAAVSLVMLSLLLKPDGRLMRELTD